MFTGCGTALVTPFRSDLSLDEETHRRLVQRGVERKFVDVLVAEEAHFRPVLVSGVFCPTLLCELGAILVGLSVRPPE